MNCCQCEGIEELFSQRYVNNALRRYHTRGPDKTTRMLTAALKEKSVEGLTLLDIGGGVGAIQHELLAGGVTHVTNVEASTWHIRAARQEAQRQGNAERISFHHGDFVDLAQDIAAADIVTLDRVICCYHDLEKLVGLSAAHARRLYGLVYPRDTWWVRSGWALENLVFRLRHSPYRAYVYPTAAVDSLLRSQGFRQRSYQQTLNWQVVVYTRGVEHPR